MLEAKKSSFLRYSYAVLFSVAFCACSTPTVSSDDSAEVEQKSSSSGDIIEGDSFVDERDGKVYKTVKIGDQVWMAENLNYATADGSFCLRDDNNNCAKYGRLYTWAAAMDSVATGCGYGSICAPTFSVQGVCPEGWHLPSETEWEALIVAVDGKIAEYSDTNVAGKALKSKTGWYKSGNGTDAFGFSALPSGQKFNKGSFSVDGRMASFWSTTEEDQTYAYDMSLDADLERYVNVAYLSHTDKSNALSVRCLKNKSDKTEQNSSSSGDFVDERDGKAYKTVKIGNQVWMAENLNYTSAYGSYCYDDETDNCAKYGRLYTWAAAMDSVTTGCGYGSTCSPTLPVQGICPKGWHLPSIAEWRALIVAVGGPKVAGKALKSQNGWYQDGNGSDTYGFSALPSGSRLAGGGNFDEGYEVDFWSASAYNYQETAYLVNMYYGYDDALQVYSGKDFAYPVRCLKD
ncbi:fibrobacter succinogenes major paralogous domain-containing protein [uncultured Fibrobacter sp.]|uniref:fibrobacter succinogenes major paralogous domain-containing protein n=1 Tax=uncultured Fibrobacter sp. TaxID=261512 RepID=UPI0025E8AFBE|nr:fibrobacter succinogenes major paralogous domain-containing protein [uncultured Fibrobacter sp.]